MSVGIILIGMHRVFHYREWTESPSVLLAGTIMLQPIPMNGRSVTFMTGESVLRVQAVQAQHHSVALDFGDDRRSADTGHRGIAANNR